MQPSDDFCTSNEDSKRINDLEFLKLKKMEIDECNSELQILRESNLKVNDHFLLKKIQAQSHLKDEFYNESINRSKQEDSRENIHSPLEYRDKSNKAKYTKTTHNESYNAELNESSDLFRHTLDLDNNYYYKQEENSPNQAAYENTKYKENMQRISRTYDETNIDREKKQRNNNLNENYDVRYAYKDPKAETYDQSRHKNYHNDNYDDYDPKYTEKRENTDKLLQSAFKREMALKMELDELRGKVKSKNKKTSKSIIEDRSANRRDSDFRDNADNYYERDNSRHSRTSYTRSRDKNLINESKEKNVSNKKYVNKASRNDHIAPSVYMYHQRGGPKQKYIEFKTSEPDFIYTESKDSNLSPSNYLRASNISETPSFDMRNKEIYSRKVSVSKNKPKNKNLDNDGTPGRILGRSGDHVVSTHKKALRKAEDLTPKKTGQKLYHVHCRSKQGSIDKYNDPYSNTKQRGVRDPIKQNRNHENVSKFNL